MNPLVVICEGTPRNSDLGDWQRDFGSIILTVKRGLPTESYIAIAVHELVEILRCEKAGITDEVVTAFDAAFLAAQKAGTKPLDAEAGDDEGAPYKAAHKVATNVERAICEALGLPWSEHEANCERISEN